MAPRRYREHGVQVDQQLRRGNSGKAAQQHGSGPQQRLRALLGFEQITHHVHAAS